MNVHKMQNRAAELLGEETHNEILTLLAGQMQFGYRLVFPTFLIGAVKPQLSVALLARANDPRVRRINGLVLSPKADHVFVFMVFAKEAEWLRYAKQVAKVFPEQSQFNGYSESSDKQEARI